MPRKLSVGPVAMTGLALLAVAAVGMLAKGGAGASDAVTVANVRHHFTFCKTCRESGYSPETLAQASVPQPCQVDGKPCTLSPIE